MSTPKPTTIASESDQLLRRDIRMLGVELGRVIRKHTGESLFDLIERVRALSKQRRHHQRFDEPTLQNLIASLEPDDLSGLIRALSSFFDLANLAEDRHRIRVLREREQERHPSPLRESIGGAVAAMEAAGLTAEQVQDVLRQLSVDLVFTAHPTEAKRRTVRRTIRRLRGDLIELERPDLLPREREALVRRISADLACLWETDTLRPSRPTVLDEVRRGLYMAENLWHVAPLIYRSMREALAREYPEATFDPDLFLRFGSWIGGDRDGNPFVTTEVTHQTLLMMRQWAVQRHLQTCDQIVGTLGVSSRKHRVSDALKQAIADAVERWKPVRERVERLSQFELYRHWLTVIRFRLERTAEADPFSELPEGAYVGADEFMADLQLIEQSLLASGHDELASGEIQDWLDRVTVFGFHLMRLDIREDSRRLQQAAGELMAALSITGRYDQLDEDQRQKLLAEPIDPAAARTLSEGQLSDETRETLALFRLIHHVVRTFGSGALGTMIISMTHQPSDALAARWLSQLGAVVDGDADTATGLPIVPLFETIDDLQRSADVLEQLLSCSGYRQHVADTGNLQICMVGYSDSTKDGGYLAANWWLQQAQSELAKVTDRHGCELIVFHGRGGSLGRGGGPAARGILSLPPSSVRGRIRITEQGEVLAERYDDPQIATRHLEQVTWATMLVTALPPDAPQPAWLELMQQLADRSFKAYRQLVEDADFVRYFREATPISGIETLAIGSRPSRRSGKTSLSDLRAIPYTFAWTQCRHVLTAFYGLGSGIAPVLDDNRKLLREMYEQWPFFRATIDNAELALAKADMFIAREYAKLVSDDDAGRRLYHTILEEYERSSEAVLAITGRAELLDNVPWLQRSIEVRNPYVDPLNLIQVDLMRRLKRDDLTESQQNELAELLRLSVQGIAAGMRTTG